MDLKGLFKSFNIIIISCKAGKKAQIYDNTFYENCRTFTSNIYITKLK